jgi:hypothetical protein
MVRRSNDDGTHPIFMHNPDRFGNSDRQIYGDGLSAFTFQQR